MEVFDLKSFGFQHLIGVAVGTVAVLIAVLGPRQYSFLSPMAFGLLGPAHFFLSARTVKKRGALEEKLALNAVPRQ